MQAWIEQMPFNNCRKLSYGNLHLAISDGSDRVCSFVWLELADYSRGTDTGETDVLTGSDFY